MTGRSVLGSGFGRRLGDERDFGMRDVYHQELDSTACTLVEMAGLVGAALERATRALLGADLALAEEVISADDAVDALQKDLDVRVLDLIARQQPVAGDLRTLVTSLRMSADLERMGDLAINIAERSLSLIRRPEVRVPDPGMVRRLLSIAYGAS